MPDIVTITDGDLTVGVKRHGAELCSIIAADGIERLWQADPLWPRHAPILFPIVGKLLGDTLRHDGKAFTLTQHGFARDLPFQLVDQTRSRAHFLLTDTPETRARYPFPFRLDVIFAVDQGILSIEYRVTNPGIGVLPASIGAHPAFSWPLPGGGAKSAHRLEFSNPEPAPIRRLTEGLLDPSPRPTPISGKILALDEALFADDALILDQLASRWVRFSARGAAPIVVAWESFNALGLWSKPGAPFLCIEPWHGTASPVGFDLDFSAKPGLMQISPGETRIVSHAIGVGETAGCALIATGG